MKKLHYLDIGYLDVLRTMNKRELEYTKSTLDEQYLVHRQFLNELSKIMAKMMRKEVITPEEQNKLDNWKAYYTLIEIQERVMGQVVSYWTQCYDKCLENADKLAKRDAKIDEKVKEDVNKAILEEKGEKQ